MRWRARGFTLGRDASQEYADAPAALEKLEYCQATLQEIGGQDPTGRHIEFDEPIEMLTQTVGEFYRELRAAYDDEMPSGLRRMLRMVAAPSQSTTNDDATRRPRSALIRLHAAELTAQAFQWTGLFSKRAIKLVERLATEAESLGLSYAAADENG